MHSRARAAIAASALLALALAGCTGGGGDPAASIEERYKDSPLYAYLDAGQDTGLSEEAMMAQHEERQKLAEELIAECMASEGFEYVPQVYSSGISFDSTEWNPDSREWVAQYGYGMVNGPTPEEPIDPEEYPEDPNQAYVMGLSESEQNAYYETLYGPQPTEEELNEDGSYEYDWESAGCNGKAYQEAYGGSPMESEEFEPLMEAINDFYMNLQSAPEFAELNREWVDCMSGAGFAGFSEQPDAQNSIMEELNAYYESMTEWIEDDPELEELGEREIALALADLDCREESDYRNASLDIQFALEERFVADHKAELEAYKAAAEQAS